MTLIRSWRPVNWLKLDFLYAGALEGGRYHETDALTDYRDGLAVI